IRWLPDGVAATYAVGGASPETAGVSRITVGGAGSWAALGTARPVVSAGGRESIEAVATVGKGTVVLVADPTIWENDLLGRTDNALAALDALGPATRPVVVAEGDLAGGTGLAALPASWRWALGVLVAAWLALLWARGKRFGPPTPLPEVAAPSRAGYVMGLASALRRTGDVDSAARLLRKSMPGGGLPGRHEPSGEDGSADELLRLARLASGGGDLSADAGHRSTAGASRP
ncbi:MAG TPA: hypothetical protein VFH45_00760, partial [Acidimicrobiales bacterium]|nr:hypothetical protein [Acidimicrobiales bacterium]